MTHTKQMYVVVEFDGDVNWSTLNSDQSTSAQIAVCQKQLSWHELTERGYTVQPVTVTIELP